MKKLLSLIVLGLLSLTMLSAQDGRFVSTTPSNRNVVLEEFTGVNCGWCPAGHGIANDIYSAHPDRVVLINVHEGYYAANTYTTQFGEALGNQFSVSSWPSGTVNRHTFSMGSVLNRDKWEEASNQILAMSSPVNIAARGTLDWSTRELVLTVQLYYTAEETVENSLNVAILQDNVVGPQAGSSLNPSQVEGTHYRHMHMLRHLITGQWGETVDSTTEGSFVEKTYRYTIPESLGSPTAIQARIEDLHFVAFVARGHKDILTGCKVDIVDTNQPSLMPRVDYVDDNPQSTCDNLASVTMSVKNSGTEPITSMKFKYLVGGSTEPHYYNWTGNIPALSKAAVSIDPFVVSTNTNQMIKTQLLEANGEAVSSDMCSVSIRKNWVYCAGSMTLKIKTDQFASETSYKIYGPNGNVVQQGSNFSNNAVNSFPFNPSEPGCYRLEVKDAYGDGISGGYIRLYNADNYQILNIATSSMGYGVQAMLSVTALGIEDNAQDNIVIFPNPVSDVINITADEPIRSAQIYNLQGQLVRSENGDVHTVSVYDLTNGVYVMKVVTESGSIATQKIIKH